MRPAAWVSESAQCTATSWADHSRGAGRQVRASAGTAAMAARSRAGPAAEASMRVRRSAAVMAMARSSLGVRLRYTEPPMLELGQVILGVRDLDAARRRMEGLGFTVLPRRAHPSLGAPHSP